MRMMKRKTMGRKSTRRKPLLKKSFRMAKARSEGKLLKLLLLHQKKRRRRRKMNLVSMDGRLHLKFVVGLKHSNQVNASTDLQLTKSWSPVVVKLLVV